MYNMPAHISTISSQGKHMRLSQMPYLPCLIYGSSIPLKKCFDLMTTQTQMGSSCSLFSILGPYIILFYKTFIFYNLFKINNLFDFI